MDCGDIYTIHQHARPHEVKVHLSSIEHPIPSLSADVDEGCHGLGHECKPISPGNVIRNTSKSNLGSYPGDIFPTSVQVAQNKGHHTIGLLQKLT